MTIGNGVPWVDGNVIIFKYTILRTDGTEDDAKMVGGNRDFLVEDYTS